MNDTKPTTERRQDLELRAVFDEIYPRLEALLDTSRSWGGSALTMLAYRLVREACPQLSAERAQTLVAAAQRVHRLQTRQGAAATLTVAG